MTISQCVLGNLGVEGDHPPKMCAGLLARYFAGWGLAEQVRWMLAATDVPWTQTALEGAEELAKMRVRPRGPGMDGARALPAVWRSGFEGTDR